ncbi:hypothetical protein [Microvirgula aerodenitrificans]|uniref:hypothetical protein n=1 Tax=Microvirgula aerodenitrificans TaxID=57480 RepID=UPI002F4073D1
MFCNKLKLNDVINDFITSLSMEKLRELDRLIINYQVEESVPWYENVILRYLKGENSSALIEEIDELFSDESELKFIEANIDKPIFEAKIILREAQKAASKRP